MEAHSSFQDAYVETLRRLRAVAAIVDGVNDPTSVGSHFGTVSRPTREIVAAGFVLTNPRSRLLSLRARPLSYPYLVANVICTLGGGNDVEMISSYNKRGKSFAKDSSYFEAAFGARLFAPGQQLRSAERRLKADRTSRRATSMMFNPEDSVIDRLDVPCGLGMHFMIRNDQLLCVTMMRSQSAAMVMPYDVFLFTVMHELLAIRLQIPLGPHHHFCSSLHYYEEETNIVNDVLAETPLPLQEMRPIEDASDDMLTSVVQAEQYLRHTKRLKGEIDPSFPQRFGLDQFWTRFLDPLVADTFDDDSARKWIVAMGAGDATESP